MAQSRLPDKILIINNASTDGTTQMLQELCSKSELRCEHHLMSENVGGAAGFREGIRLASQSCFDWIWIMDDDAEPAPDCLQRLLEAQRDMQAGAYCPAIYGNDGTLQGYHHKVFSKWGREKLAWDGIVPSKLVRLDANAFVGPMFSARVIRTVGLPDSNLISQGDDTEFTLRVSRAGTMVLVVAARMRHKDAKREGKWVIPAWKIFYLYRNRLWMLRKYFGMFTALAYGAQTLAGTLLWISRPQFVSARLRAVGSGLFRRYE